MPTTNPTTGDRIISKPSTDKYRDNPIWDKWEAKKKHSTILLPVNAEKVRKIESDALKSALSEAANTCASYAYVDKKAKK